LVKKGEFGDRFLNDRLSRTVDVQAIVVDAVDRKAVEAWPIAADRAAGTLHATLLRGGARREDRKFLDVAAERVHRQIVDNLLAKSRAELGGFGLNEFGSGLYSITEETSPTWSMAVASAT
jgi:hypothetical protein